MKKLGLFAMAFALLMGMSQCKKENTNTSADESAKVPITLNVNGGNGSRVAVNTENGVVTFENGDVLYVASGGAYVGTLTYNGTVFSGNVTEPTEGQKLQFYFFGNVNPEEVMTEGSTTGCSVVISDQTEHLPVISYAPSRENYQVGLTAYNATLLNKCALVKFDVTSASEAATCIVGMNNKVTVDFTDNSFVYNQDSEGIITLPAGTGYHWAILLPQDEMSDVEVVTEDNGYIGTIETIPAISENDYLTDGVWVELEVNIPEGAIGGLFSINANGDKVYFSQGNLQYQASTNTWRFAENQWDYVGTQIPDENGDFGGTIIGSDNMDISQLYDGWIDLFGWGTSGYNHGATAYQPWSTNENSSDYYAYGQYTYNLYDQTGHADWGYNAIINGGNIENSGWRTLTTYEWSHIIFQRSNIRYAKAKVNGVNGLILLPDNWTSSVYTLYNTNNYSANYTSNIISAEDWASTFETNGAIFLPAGGDRYLNQDWWNNDYYWTVRSAGEGGNYWSASIGSSSNYASCMYFSRYGIHNLNYYSRNTGQSVRLVRNVE